MLPYLGSGPFSNTSGSGYYTVKDYRDILKHARSRYVDIIPEIDLPGHSHAAIRSMESRYRKYMAAGNSEAAWEYLLSDPTDKSNYVAMNELHNTTINVCMPSALRFTIAVATSIRDLHKVIKT